MNFVDKFLDLAAPIPRKIVRFLKLLKTVEETSKEKLNNLQKNREKYIQKLKENDLKNHESSLKLIEKEQKELLNLSDYKLEIIKELNYIIEQSFINKISPIIEEGKKECDNNLNGMYGVGNSEKSILNDYLNNTDYNNKKKDDLDSSNATGTTNFLRNKKNRTKSLKGKRNNIGLPPEYSDENTQNLQNGEKQKVYCRCKKPSFGDMIECENPKCPNGQWFHYSCVEITEGKIPTTEWYCSKKCQEEAKNLKKKNKRKKNI